MLPLSRRMGAVEHTGQASKLGDALLTSSASRQSRCSCRCDERRSQVGSAGGRVIAVATIAALTLPLSLLYPYRVNHDALRRA